MDRFVEFEKFDVEPASSKMTGTVSKILINTDNICAVYPDMVENRTVIVLQNTEHYLKGKYELIKLEIY